MVVTLSYKNEYIPEWNGNKDQEKPITFVYATPTLQHYNDLIRKPMVKMTTDKAGKIDGGVVELSVDYATFVRSMVKSIKNLSYIINDEKEAQITNVKELFSANTPPVFAELVDEVGAFLREELENRVDAKK